METANVPVRSGWLSKINWTQLGSFIASLLAVFSIDISPEQTIAVVLGIQALQSIGTVILRQFFTKSVTASSVK